jgi:type IV pilus assembly protein PilY1
MKGLLALLLCLTLLPLNVPLVRADDSDIFGAGIEPNILIFIDSSGSMDDTIPAEVYNPAVTYVCSNPPCKTSAAVYKDNGGKKGYGDYAATIAAVPDANVPPSSSASAARDALSTVGHWSGKIGKGNVTLFTGNYLNYVDSPASAVERKIVIAKRVLTKLINNTDGVRLGLAKFTGNSTMGPGGAEILANVGSSKSSLITALNGISPSGYTPMQGALYDMGRYYKGNMSGHLSPIQYDCQPNFIIMMSDGLQNGYGDVRDEATLRRTQDHSTPLPGTQNVLVHTVGFAVPDTDKAAANAVLQTTADNGGGSFFSTETEGQLETALEHAIQQIMTATFAFATPVIPTTSATGIARAYLAAFQSNPSAPFWQGYLKAYDRGSDGLVPTDPNTGVPLDSALAWEAGQQLALKAASARTIYTVTSTTHTSGTAPESFSKANGNITQVLLGAASSAERDKIIDFARGVDVNDENLNGNTTEDRAWKLGDIYHSTPVLVSAPFLPSPDPTYAAFRAAQHTRTAVVIAGANDGMLHAFRELDGEELWAFIPRNVLPNLKKLIATSGSHEFFVDGSPVAADVKVSGTWKTIVIFGERRGGAYYHALDITDTTNPLYLWSFTDTKIAETWSEPVIGKVKMSAATGSTERYVAFFGGGYDTPSNNSHGKAVFAVDVATGQKLWEYYNNGTADDRQYMNYSIPANPLAMDLNNDGFIDRLYMGDVGGQLWKFDLSAAATLTGGTSGTVNNWTGKRFFRASTDTNPPALGEYYPTQAIYGMPNAALLDGKLWVFFGTGDRNHPNNASANRFYGIRDDQTSMTNGTAWTEADLANATGGAADLTVKKGWYVPLASTEKVLAAPDIFNKIVYFTTFTPTTTTVCGSGGGTAKLYAVQIVNGFAAIDWSNDTVLGSNATASTERGKEIGQGIPSKPIFIINDQGVTVSATVTAGTTNQQLPNNPAPPPANMRRILYWREAL